MRRFTWIGAVLAAGLILAFGQWSVNADEAVDEADTHTLTEEEIIERGRYLAVDVAMCVQCHTPRDSRGRLIESSLFRGASVPVDSRVNAVRFATRAPALAGLPGYEEDAFIQLMTTGLTKRGGEAMAPMPPYRMNKEDAQAISKYLRTLR